MQLLVVGLRRLWSLGDELKESSGWFRKQPDALSVIPLPLLGGAKIVALRRQTCEMNQRGGRPAAELDDAFEHVRIKRGRRPTRKPPLHEPSGGFPVEWIETDATFEECVGGRDQRTVEVCRSQTQEPHGADRPQLVAHTPKEIVGEVRWNSLVCDDHRKAVRLPQILSKGAEHIEDAEHLSCPSSCLTLDISRLKQLMHHMLRALLVCDPHVRTSHLIDEGFGQKRERFSGILGLIPETDGQQLGATRAERAPRTLAQLGLNAVQQAGLPTASRSRNDRAQPLVDVAENPLNLDFSIDEELLISRGSQQGCAPEHTSKLAELFEIALITASARVPIVVMIISLE